MLTSAPDQAEALLALFKAQGVPARRIGTVGGETLAVKVGGGKPCELSWPVAGLHRAWDESLAANLAM